MEKDNYTHIPREDMGIFSAPTPRWPDFVPLNLVGEYSLRLLTESEKDFNLYAKFWRKAYSSLEGGGADFVLHPGNYPLMFGRGKTFMKEAYAGFVFEDCKENMVFGGMLLYLDMKNRAANALLMAVLPEYRNNFKIGKFLYKFSECYDKFVEDSGVEYAWSGAATNHDITQKLLRHIGYKVRGVYYGWTVSAINKVYYRRDNYVYMDKFYNQGHKRYPVELKLIPEARKVLDVIEEL